MTLEQLGNLGELIGSNVIVADLSQRRQDSAQRVKLT